MQGCMGMHMHKCIHMDMDIFPPCIYVLIQQHSWQTTTLYKSPYPPPHTHTGSRTSITSSGRGSPLSSPKLTTVGPPLPHGPSSSPRPPPPCTIKQAAQQHLQLAREGVVMSPRTFRLLNLRVQGAVTMPRSPRLSTKVRMGPRTSRIPLYSQSTLAAARHMVCGGVVCVVWYVVVWCMVVWCVWCGMECVGWCVDVCGTHT